MELFGPMLEAAVPLPEESQQKNFMYLQLTIFYNVLRNAITSNKALFV